LRETRKFVDEAARFVPAAASGEASPGEASRFAYVGGFAL